MGLRTGAIAILVAFLLTGAYVRSIFGPPYTVAAGTPVRHDDFVFTVRAVHRLHGSAEDRYFVDIDVENQARVVNYRWDDRIAYVRDASGPRYYPQNPHELTISPGDTAHLRLQFRLPHDLRAPQLRFWDGIYMGDAFNGVRYARAATSLK